VVSLSVKLGVVSISALVVNDMTGSIVVACFLTVQAKVCLKPLVVTADIEGCKMAWPRWQSACSGESLPCHQSMHELHDRMPGVSCRFGTVWSQCDTDGVQRSSHLSNGCAGP